MNTRITANTLLEPGTRVQVQTRRGFVHTAKTVPASNGGSIALHTVIFTERFKGGFGKNGKWIPIPHTEPKGVNYTAIVVLGPSNL